MAGLPATLGRDPTVEIPLREPTVSRHHARLSPRDNEIEIEDLGSRGGTRLGGYPLAGRLVLRGAGEVALGSGCVLRFAALDGGVLELRGLSGLDREHFTLVGGGRVELGSALGLPGGLALGFSTGVARLERAVDLPIRVDGQLIGRGCDLLHGDRIELPGGSHIEVL